MVSFVQLSKVAELKEQGWFNPGSPNPDIMKAMIGGPTLIYSPDEVPHYVYSDGTVVELMPITENRFFKALDRLNKCRETCAEKKTSVPSWIINEVCSVLGDETTLQESASELSSQDGLRTD